MIFMMKRITNSRMLKTLNKKKRDGYVKLNDLTQYVESRQFVYCNF